MNEIPQLDIFMGTLQTIIGGCEKGVDVRAAIADTIRVPEDVLQAAELTPYAVDSRYPGLYEDVTYGEYQEAVRLAGRVVTWVEEALCI